MSGWRPGCGWMRWKCCSRWKPAGRATVTRSSASSGRRATRSCSAEGRQADGRRPSEVPAPGLLPLDGLEQRLEVALAESLRAVALDQLEEHRRPVLHRLGEDLQQVAVLVPVGKNAQLPERPGR